MICKICKTSNDEGSKYCISCGATLTRESTNICPNGHIYSSNLSKCPFCPSPELKMKAGINDVFGTGNTSTMSNKNDKTSIMGSNNIGNKTMILGGDAASNTPSKGRKLKGWLVSFSNNHNGEDYKLFEGRNLISGSSDGDIKLSDPAISSPHCLILFRNESIKIKDQLSTNGTYLNEQLIDEAELKDNDLIKIGKTVFKIKLI